MSHSKEIHLRESTRKLYVIAGYLLIASGLISLLLGGPTGGLVLGVGILNLILAHRAEKTPIIVITRDHLELKLAPLRAKQFVHFDEIHRIRHEKDKLVIQTRMDEIGIPAKAMDDIDFQRLERVLRSRAG
jgi:hypothetical protein